MLARRGLRAVALQLVVCGGSPTRPRKSSSVGAAFSIIVAVGAVGSFAADVASSCQDEAAFVLPPLGALFLRIWASSFSVPCAAEVPASWEVVSDLTYDVLLALISSSAFLAPIW